jgi:hypothetical protein
VIEKLCISILVEFILMLLLYLGISVLLWVEVDKEMSQFEDENL